MKEQDVIWHEWCFASKVLLVKSSYSMWSKEVFRFAKRKEGSHYRISSPKEKKILLLHHSCCCCPYVAIVPHLHNWPAEWSEGSIQYTKLNCSYCSSIISRRKHLSRLYANGKGNIIKNLHKLLVSVRRWMVFELKLDPEYHFSNQPLKKSIFKVTFWFGILELKSVCQPMWKIMVYEIQVT